MTAGVFTPMYNPLLSKGMVPFLLRYYPEYFLLGQNRNYTTIPFTSNGATPPTSVNGRQNDTFYQGNYTSYDNWADMNQEITDERIKLNIVP